MILEEDDWNDVIKECSSLAAKWEQLSGYLGLSIGTIDAIKENFSNNVAGCLNEALKQWIKQNYRTARYGYPSWRMLLEAIARIDKLLFKKLADKHQGVVQVPSDCDDPLPSYVTVFTYQTPVILIMKWKLVEQVKYQVKEVICMC